MSQWFDGHTEDTGSCCVGPPFTEDNAGESVECAANCHQQPREVGVGKLNTVGADANSFGCGVQGSGKSCRG